MSNELTILGLIDMMLICHTDNTSSVHCIRSQVQIWKH